MLQFYNLRQLEELSLSLIEMHHHYKNHSHHNHLGQTQTLHPLEERDILQFWYQKKTNQQALHYLCIKKNNQHYFIYHLWVLKNRGRKLILIPINISRITVLIIPFFWDA